MKKEPHAANPSAGLGLSLPLLTEASSASTQPASGFIHLLPVCTDNSLHSPTLRFKV